MTPLPPSLSPPQPTPSKDSEAVQKLADVPQSCRLVVTALGRSYMYQSTTTYPCSMTVDPEKTLGAGKCFGGAPVA